MVTGMATRKVTVTLDEAQLDQIRTLVQARTAPSVSGFVQHAVAVALDDIAGWGAMLADALGRPAGRCPTTSAPGPTTFSAAARGQLPDAGRDHGRGRPDSPGPERPPRGGAARPRER